MEAHTASPSHLHKGPHPSNHPTGHLKGLTARALFRFLSFDASPFFVTLHYFVVASSLGFLILRALPMRDPAADRPNDLDLFFTSVSATTVSSMSAIEMEAFSNSQLLLMSLLMLLGGEVFTSMLGLQFNKIKFSKQWEEEQYDQIELGSTGSEFTKYDLVRYLGFVVMAYVTLAQLTGCLLIMVYLMLFRGASAVLEGKGINRFTFSMFTAISSFTNCGFVPTNENMIVFRDFPGLLLTILGLLLCGNTMYPSSLRFVLSVLGKITKRREADYILRDHRELGYGHLLSSRRSVLLAFTVAGFVFVQFVLFCGMEWRSAGLEGMNRYHKVVGALFQSVNSRHAGESIVDISILSPAILVLYVVMMYLPPYTTFVPIEDGEVSRDPEDNRKRKGVLKKMMIFSQLSYLAIFTIIICITERRQLHEDPLNFNVLNIVFEVVSAYGNVGFSVGYSCRRQLKADMHCRDSWSGFSARWSSKGKIALIVVMLFGRLKNFSRRGGKSWILY